MNNVQVKRNNYKLFKSHSKCNCVECRFNNGRRFTIAKDFITEEELKDEDGWI